MNQQAQRVYTNQTSNSNKGSSKNSVNNNYESNSRSKYAKNNSNNRSYDHGNSNNSHSFQLPKVLLSNKKINRSSNIDTTSNRSYDLDLLTSQKQQNIQKLAHIEETQRQFESGVVNYNKMTMEQIKHQYQRLRKQFNILTMEIKRAQQMQQSRVSKKSRSISTVETQKVLAKTEMQVYQNSLLLQKLRSECEQLDRRSNLANSSISRPNAQMNEKILKLKQKILTTKDKIKLLRKRTKKSGQDIVNVQDVHELAQKLQRENKNYELKLASLQAKLQESKFKIQRQDQKLVEIQKTFSDAEDYMKLFKLQTQQLQQKMVIQKQYHQLKHKKQIIKKKIQSDQQTYIQKYHQLLKLLEGETEKQQKMNKKLIQEDIKILRARNSVLQNERELNSLQEIMDRFKEQENMKKEAEILRKAIEQQSIAQGYESTFLLTEQGKISSTISNPLMGSIVRNNISNKKVRRLSSNIENSIMQQNESGLNETIEASKNNIIEIDENQQNLKINNDQKQLDFSKDKNRGIILSSNLNEKNKHGYHITAKQISKKRQQARGNNVTTSQMKKQFSQNDVKTGRKAHSLMRVKDIDSNATLRHKQAQQQSANHTLSSITMNMLSNFGSIDNRNKDSNKDNKVDSKEKSTMEGNRQMVATSIHDHESMRGKQGKGKEKQIYMRNVRNSSGNKNSNDNNKSSNHQKELQRMKSTLKNRKNNSSIADQAKQSDGEILDQLERINRELIGQNNTQRQYTQKSVQRQHYQKKQQVIENKKLLESQKKQVNHKKGQIRHRKLQVMAKIDQNNIEYSKRITQLKKQMRSSQDLLNMQRIPNESQKNSQASMQKQMKQENQIKGISSIDHGNKDKETEQQINDEVVVQDKVNEEVEDEDEDIDDDIQDDIVQINEMVRKKRIRLQECEQQEQEFPQQLVE